MTDRLEPAKEYTLADPTLVYICEYCTQTYTEQPATCPICDENGIYSVPQPYNQWSTKDGSIKEVKQ